MKIAESIGKQVLVLIDEVYLAQQWKEYFLENSNVTEDEIFLLTGTTGIKEERKKMESINNIKVIISTKDTIVTRNQIVDTINETVGLTVIDECHRNICGL